ncbi:hypothetical protein NL676_033232 [Syzygium grande]|nr:hypothetical protein NL676_033232 [Syzygium grande]
MAKARAPTSSAGRVLAVMAVVLGVMLRSAEAATYIVGNATGWSNVANAVTFYSNWASGQTFQVDDILVFNFISPVSTTSPLFRSRTSQAALPVLRSVSTILRR